MREVPAGWAWTTLGEIADLKGGLTKGKKRRDEDRLRSVPYLRVQNVQRGYLNLEEVKLIEATEAEIEGLRLRAGDVLFNEGGDRDKLGRGWVWQAALPECIHQNHVFRARMRAPGIDPKFVSWYGNSEGARYFNDQGKQTTNLASISLTKLSEFPVPLPPASEQRRTVAEIERQYTRLDAGEISLHEGQRELAVCRRAVLQAAIQGRLNNATERCKEWPYVPLGDLAEGSANSVTDGPFGSNLKTEHYTDVGPRVIRLQNIGDGSFIEQRSCISPAHFERLKKHAVEPGDLLIAALGSELPRACLAPDSLGPAIVKADCIRFRPDAAQVSAQYLCHALNSHGVRQATRKLVHGVGRPRLNLSEIKSIRIPLPPIKDQLEIVEAAEDELSLIDAVEDALRTSLQKAARLRQSILRKAFEGKLVPQDPNDEPASVLLERIRAARAQTPVRRAPRKREVYA